MSIEPDVGLNEIESDLYHGEPDIIISFTADVSTKKPSKHPLHNYSKIRYLFLEQYRTSFADLNRKAVQAGDSITSLIIIDIETMI